MDQLRITIAAATHVGIVRKNNEDNFIVCPDLCQGQWLTPQNTTPFSLGDYGCMLAVADGMGGANAGEVASGIVVQTIMQECSHDTLAQLLPDDQQPDDKTIQSFLVNLLNNAHNNIIEHAKSHPETDGMGTTAVLCWILGDYAYLVWCGDSRCYVFNHDSGLSRLSKDHSLVQDLIDQGKLDDETAFDHPYSNIITRCLGDNNQKLKPDFRVYPLHHNDILLLCTDGLCGLLRDEEIIQVFENGQDNVVPLCNNLIAAALDAGGYDNVTVALCKVHGGHSDEQKQTTLKSYRSKKDGNKRGLLATLRRLWGSDMPDDVVKEETAPATSDPPADQKNG